MLSKKFQKRIEDFRCIHCHTLVKGNGYTDHCPKCLYSVHKDIYPGDRLSDCDGIMKPVHIETVGGINYICYICEKCGYKHRVKANSNDNMDAILELNKQNIDNF